MLQAVLMSVLLTADRQDSHTQATPTNKTEVLLLKANQLCYTHTQNKKMVQPPPTHFKLHTALQGQW